MTRSTAREIAIQLGFSLALTRAPAGEALDGFFDREHYETLSGESGLYSEYPDEKQLRYIRELVSLVSEHRAELDEYIRKYARGWRTERISKTAAAVVRASMCELLYMPDIPPAASINEAVELSKGYEDADVVSFINGILGSFYRGEIEKKTEE